MDKSQEKNQLQEIIKRLNFLENKFNSLEHEIRNLDIKMLYKRPGSDEYETLPETLDFLHKKVLES